MALYHLSQEKQKRVLVREYDGERDLEMVEKLERSCEVGSREGLCFLTNMMGDPLCRIRNYTVHVILVAELVGNGEVVGVVRGCMKCAGTGKEAAHVNMGCILGLRVSPKHRRVGIGLNLVKSVESWAIRNGAHYISLATDENNLASINLFIKKFDYVKFSSLIIFAQLVLPHPKKNPSQNIKIEKLTIEQAVTLYTDRLCQMDFFPVNISTILREKLSLGTWVAYFADEHWDGLHSNCQDNDGDNFTRRTPGSWAILSIWKTCEAYRLQIIGPPPLSCFHAVASRMGCKFFPCLSFLASCDLFYRPFGFLFLYGLHGEGERMGELTSALWWFAHNLAREEKDCKAIVTELGSCDPLKEYIPRGASTYHVDDLWLLKKVDGGSGTSDGFNEVMARSSVEVFVDPRDF